MYVEAYKKHTRTANSLCFGFITMINGHTTYSSGHVVCCFVCKFPYPSAQDHTGQTPGKGGEEGQGIPGEAG